MGAIVFCLIMWKLQLNSYWKDSYDGQTSVVCKAKVKLYADPSKIDNQIAYQSVSDHFQKNGDLLSKEFITEGNFHYCLLSLRLNARNERDLKAEVEKAMHTKFTYKYGFSHYEVLKFQYYVEPQVVLLNKKAVRRRHSK